MTSFVGVPYDVIRDRNPVFKYRSIRDHYKRIKHTLQVKKHTFIDRCAVNISVCAPSRSVRDTRVSDT